MPTDTRPVAADARARPQSPCDPFTRTILDHATEAIVSIDGAGLIRSFNRAAERMFGWAEDEVLDRPTSLLMPNPGRTRRADRPLPAAHAGHGADDGRLREGVGLRRDGTRFPMDLSVTPYDTEAGPRVAWIVRDISDRKRLEDQLRQSQKMDAMGQLAGGVAHDFNNLLTVINGWCEALSSASPDERRGAIDQITGAAAKAANLTKQLLTFSRKSVVSPRVVDLNAVIDDVGRMLRRVIGEDIVLESVMSATPAFVRVDPGQMGQVLVNLALNARDAMPRGGTLTICTSRRAMDARAAAPHGLAPGVYVVLSVTDTGTGIPDEALPRLFEPFFTTKSERGTGLGLATAYAIVHQAGGVIRAANAPERGAEFTILLPESQEEQAVIAPVKGTVQESGTETVLVVEDEAQVRAITVSMLQSRGYQVLAASTAQEALGHAASNEHIDILVSDVVMPDLSGPELATRIRTVHPGIRVLLVSGYSADAVARHGANGGAPSFLQKPFTGPQLAHKVREVLMAQAGSAAAGPTSAAVLQ